MKTIYVEGRVFPDDAAQHPYAQDLDGMWHQRPAADPWVNSMEQANCRTRCGRTIGSVCVSEYKPEPEGLYGDATICPCVELAPE